MNMMFLAIQESDSMWSQLILKMETWWDAIILRMPNLAVAILVMVVFYFIAKGTSSLLRRVFRKYLGNQSVRRIIIKVVFACILFIGFFVALSVMDLDKALTSLLAGAGVVALAIGLALQGTLSNTFSGIMLSFLPKIKIGDYIETDSHGGFVHEISLRNLVLRRPDNHYVIMPNSKFVEEPFVNFSLAPRSRITVSCGIAYGSDLRKVEELVREAISGKFEQRPGERVEFYFLEFSDFSINFMVRFWVDFVKKSQMYQAQHEAILLINDIFNDNNIRIPFPIRTLDVSDRMERLFDNKSGDPQTKDSVE
ncbi:mechanosensitive ion channel family protein [Nonlabens marinus]|uniref:Potassium efflux system KefA protein / Small-conductance mechanosensitive channel n=1 Tax=Nonlabens marinus S1-08 TaxID=1454201 RepID=W8VSP4_9FLAO|nr:mechanosensitive ion channel [Nonlabens marinus]BAO56385.1 potassium efflux system KefA protein / Small-conductance mechanosensitive channel [Nonlabens marinus S1-08]